MGRLIRTTGLLIVTNDGILVNEIGESKNNVGKTYILRALSKITSKDISSLRDGIEISYSDDGRQVRYTTTPANVHRISDYSIEITNI